MDADILQLQEEMQKLQVLVRTNNLLLSRFILELSNIQQRYNLPQRVVFFKFELMQDEYNRLVEDYGKSLVDKALYQLDRLLLTNKQQCPNNIAKYIRRKLKRKDYENTRNHAK